MRAVVVFALAVVTMAYGLVTGFRVEPVKVAWSGRADPEDGVSQVLTINFDELDSTSGAYCELFAGTKGGGGDYHVSVLTYPGGTEIATGNVGGAVDHEWVKFNLGVRDPDSIVKGKKLAFKFTRSGSDSIQYYYDSACGYGYGQMIAPYPPMITPSYGLAMRCYGRMKPVVSTDFGVNLPAFPIWSGWTHEDRVSWSESLTVAGAGWAPVEFGWNAIESNCGTYDFTLTDSMVAYMDSGVEPVGLLVNCPRWASTAMESIIVEVRDTFGECLYYDTLVDTSVHCPPINLLPTGGSTNYFARWVDTVIGRYGSLIHTWLVWNEPNDTCSSPTKDITGWWRRPWWHYQLGGGARPLCSLYVRLCWVADSVINAADSTDRVLVGNMHKVRFTDEWHPPWLVPGVDWLDLCCAVADSVFWDGVGFHAYQEPSWFDSDTFTEDVDTLRAVMRGHGDYGELWNTEAGWAKDFDDSVESRERAARNLCRMLVSTEASDASPSGVCDRSSWWFYWENNPRWGHEPLLDSSFNRQRVFFAFQQTCTTLVGKRFNGRVMTGDTAIDNYTRVYEFEDTTAQKTRTWVCWQDEVVAAYTPLPVRSDTVDTVALAYDGSPPADEKDAENSGWLRISLDPRPTFATERSAVSRPDVVVDSIAVDARALPWIVTAWATNRGGRATPHDTSGTPYPTWAALTANGDSVAETSYVDSIGVNESVTFVITFVPAQPQVALLLEVRANPGQSYVELGVDDNAGYALKVQ